MTKREKMNEITKTDVMDRLPRECYTVDLVYGKLIRIKRGVMGYFPTTPLPPSADARQYADKFNADNGITKAQEEAMVAGLMFGFHVPAADPLNYTKDGKAKKLKNEDEMVEASL